MHTASDRFVQALAASHSVYTRATLIEADGTTTAIPIESGTVSLDESAATRASVTLEVIAADDPDFWVPDGLESPLAPNGNEIEVARGIVFADDTVEEVLLGTFRIDSSDGSSQPGDLTVSVTALDRSAILIESTMQREEGYPSPDNPGLIEEGMLCTEAIQALVQDAYPSCEFDFIASAITLPALSFEVGQDRWDLCQGIAEAAQCRLYFDSSGKLVLRPRTESQIALATYAEGDGGMLLGASANLTREDACNRVNVSGENSSADPAYGEAFDDDPNSPTRYGEPFGRRSFEWSSQYITTDEQAADVAETILDRKKGLPKSISFDSLSDPRLEPADTVWITREELKIDELHIIDSVTIPLGYEGDMSAQTRVSQVQS